MEKLSPAAAIEDLLWLDKRFRNILSLLPRLEGIASLENFESELKKAVADHQAALATLKGDVDAWKNVIENQKVTASEIVEDARSEADQVVKNAYEEAERLRQEAREGLTQEISNLAAQKQKKTKEVDELAKKSNELSLLIIEQEKAFEELTNAIKELKARF